MTTKAVLILLVMATASNYAVTIWCPDLPHVELRR